MVFAVRHGPCFHVLFASVVCCMDVFWGFIFVVRCVVCCFADIISWSMFELMFFSLT